MLPLVHDDTPREDIVFSEFYNPNGYRVGQEQRNGFMAKWQHIKYCDYTDGQPQLFDLRKDPDELHNLINDPDYQNTLHRLQQALHELPEPWRHGDEDWTLEARPQLASAVG